MSPDYDYRSDKKQGKNEIPDDFIRELREHERKKQLDMRRLDESNPHEQKKKFYYVKENPPDPDFMKVSVHQETDEKGNDVVVSESKGLDGTVSRMVHDPFFVFSPYIGFMANIAKAPLHVVPMLIDEAMNVVAEEKKAFKPEKRKDENRFGWILFVVLAVIGSIVGFAFLATRIMGGG